MKSTPIEDILLAYYGAWSRGNPAEIAAYFTEDCVFEDLAFDATFEGRSGVTAFAGITFNGAPDFSIAVDHIVVQGDRAAAAWTMSGTHTGDMPGFPATGRPFAVRASSMIGMRDGLIGSMVDYWNPLALSASG